ncbi:MAG: PTS sugar transporter subunit IIB [Bacilli bacterium]
MEILLCCGAGMSSGFLANKARKAAKKSSVDVVIHARSQSEVIEYLPQISVLLLGPHLGAELANYQQAANGYDVKVAVIPKDIYSSLDGERLLSFALDLRKNK